LKIGSGDVSRPRLKACELQAFLMSISSADENDDDNCDNNGHDDYSYDCS